MKIEVHSLSKQLTIRRYLDLPKLFEFLVFGRLYLSAPAALAVFRQSR